MQLYFITARKLWKHLKALLFYRFCFHTIYLYPHIFATPGWNPESDTHPAIVRLIQVLNLKLCFFTEYARFHENF